MIEPKKETYGGFVIEIGPECIEVFEDYNPEYVDVDWGWDLEEDCTFFWDGYKWR